MKYYYIIMAVAIALLLTGCNNTVESSQQKKISDITENSADISDNIPEIIFLHTVIYPQDTQKPRMITFYDRNGNYFRITNDEKVNLSASELVEEYRAGKLNDSIELISTCQVSELKSNYEKLCKLSQNNDFSLKEFDEVPAVETEEYAWYGLYLSNNEYKEIMIQKKDAAGEHEPNDQTAADIYKWILSSFSSDNQ